MPESKKRRIFSSHTRIGRHNQKSRFLNKLPHDNVHHSQVMLDQVDQSTYKYLKSQPSNAPELNGRKFVIMDKHDYINYVKKSQRMTKDFVWLVH